MLRPEIPTGGMEGRGTAGYVSGHVFSLLGGGGGERGRGEIGTVNQITDNETQHRPGPETNRRNMTESNDNNDLCFLDLNKDIKRILNGHLRDI